MKSDLFYIAQYFTPEPYLKDITFIKGLKDKGWNPTVITGFPNYPKGRIYEGYRNKWFLEEEMEGIRVIRVWTYADHSLNSFKRTLNYFVFAVFAALAILKYGKPKSFYYILQSSPFVIVCAWAVRLFKYKSFCLLDIQDVFPENIRVSGFIKSRTALKMLDIFLNTFYYHTFNAFVTVSESFRQLVINKGVSPNHVLTLYNWSMVENKTALDTKYEFPGNDINIVYAGNIGVHQGLSCLAEAMMIISRERGVHFHFFGDGTDEAKLREQLAAVSGITFHGRIPAENIGKFLNAADILFLHLVKDPVYRSIIPSKLQAYIEVGKPLLAGLEGEAAELVNKNDLGEVFEPENKEDFIRAVSAIKGYSTMKKSDIRLRSQELYLKLFSRSTGLDRLSVFMDAIYNEKKCKKN